MTDTPLPAPIAAYFAANARFDVDAMLGAFAEDAVVLDEGGRHVGRAAVRDWIASATVANQAIFTPVRWRDDDGTLVVGGQVAGAFPGSPVALTFHIMTDGDAITHLEIG